MKKRHLLIAISAIVITVPTGWALLRESVTGQNMTAAADKFVASLSDQQRKNALMPYDSEKRLDWHFIPKSERKGLQIKEMSTVQRQSALALLWSCLSQVGYDKATKIMALESVLAELEKKRQGGPLRDPERYYYTIFGEPGGGNRWGLSIEGHHLSLNFAVENGQVISSTPTFFAAHPAIMKSTVIDTPKGMRLLAKEEQLAFDLLKSLTDEQKQTAVIADKAPREIRGAGTPQPPTDDPQGITYGKLNDEQKHIMRDLVTAYADNLPAEVSLQRRQDIRDAGPTNVYFAWAGAQQEGIGHYYRIQGPTFLIEFVNTQPDSAGNPANHIHCVWRDMRGDFAISLSN